MIHRSARSADPQIRGCSPVHRYAGLLGEASTTCHSPFPLSPLHPRKDAARVAAARQELKAAALSAARAAPRHLKVSMAGRLFRGVLQLGKSMKRLHLGKPMEDRARTLYTGAVDKGDFIRPGFKFGHKPFGAHYGQDVELGDDGLPLSVDWTQILGAVWPAQDQGEENGICYIFAPLGSISSLNFIKTGKSIVLSAQQVLDCNTLTGGTITGGDPYRVADFAIKSRGILPAELYPFTGVKGMCKSVRGPGVTIDAWKHVKRNDEDALKYAVAYQPVVVNIGVKGPILVKNTIIPFRHYTNGIMRGPNCTILNHSALVVGYGETEEGKLFWLLLNSYGAKWGRSGLFMIARSTRQRGGALGILRDPFVPLKWSRNRMVTSKCESCAKCF